MSISDELMWRYIELLSFASLETVAKWKADVAVGSNPRDIKVGFAQEIVTRFHSAADAEKALADFQTRSKGGIPDDVPEVTVTIDGVSIGVAQLLKLAGLVSSTSEAFRAIEQGGIKLDGEKVTDKALVLNKGAIIIAQVGKRKFANVTIL